MTSARLAARSGLLAVSLLVPFAGAQAKIDLERAAAELAQTLERPAGTVIGAAQKEALDAFLERYRDADLGPLGYAKAMRRYLDRDVQGAAALLDEFFAEHDTIANEEHRKVAGRIYLGAIAAAAREDGLDEAKLRTRAETMTRFYDDYGVVARVVGGLLRSDKLQDPAALRVALVRGASASRADATKIDAFVRDLYAPAAPAPTPARAESPLVGQPAPAWMAKDVIRADGNSEPLALAQLAGKVVVLDFFASWCPPCRASLPHLVELQAKHAKDLQVVSLTRLYGYGMDFSGPDATTPHGGRKVEDLSPAAEVDLYRDLVRVFGLSHPIAFVDKDVFTAYGVRGIPTLVVLDRTGRVVGVQVGSNDAAVDALVEKALGGKREGAGSSR